MCEMGRQETPIVLTRTSFAPLRVNPTGTSFCAVVSGPQLAATNGISDRCQSSFANDGTSQPRLRVPAGFLPLCRSSPPR